MNWENLGYMPLSDEELRNIVCRNLEAEDEASIEAAVEQLKQERLDGFVLGLLGHGPITIGVCFNESDGKFINSYSKQNSMSGYSRRSILSATKNSIIRSFRTPDEVDAYFMALDDVAAGYVELNKEAVDILKQLKPSF